MLPSSKIPEVDVKTEATTPVRGDDEESIVTLRPETSLNSGAAGPHAEFPLKTTLPLGAHILIDFGQGDGRNPLNFSPAKKWTITILVSIFGIFASGAATSYNQGYNSMIRDLNCTQFQATIGLSAYTLAYAIVPLVISSFSEEFGRQRLYFISATGFIMMHLMIALSQTIQTVIIARFMQGVFGAAGIAMIAGTVADMYPVAKRGLPMAIFTASGFVANGLGALVAAWIEVNDNLGWRWIQWTNFILGIVYLVFLVAFMEETRSAVLLSRLAKDMRQRTGNQRYRARTDVDRASLRKLIWISCTRPIYLLLTEPITIGVSLWIGFAWGVYYCIIESVPRIFRSLYLFNDGETGSVFVSMTIASVVGFFTSMLQEKIYKRNVAQRGCEARLYFACVAGIVFPGAMFFYAWTASPNIPWILPVIAITIYVWAIFTIYLAIFSYIADCYGPYASSALAGQSLFRNIMATAFPLFTDQMYAALSYKWANMMVACIATILMPTPFILLYYGRVIRKHSKFCSALMGS